MFRFRLEKIYVLYWSGCSTLLELSDKIDLSDVYLSRVFNKKTTCGAGAALKLAKICNKEIDDLFEETKKWN